MNKTALITGSSAGIGAEIALKLSLNGYKVFLTGRNESRLIEQAKICSAIGYFAGDLTDENFCLNLYNNAVAKLGHVDILVNNAGGYIWSPIDKVDESKISELIKLNFEAPYRLCMHVVPQMKKQKWGRIVNIGSISGSVGEANASFYSASNPALLD